MQSVSPHQSFDGGNLRAVLHHRESEAGINPTAANENRAGTALTVIATFLVPGEVEMMTQRIEQRRPRSHMQSSRNPIDMQRDGHCVRERSVRERTCWNGIARRATGCTHRRPPALPSKSRAD